jgi:hypothetical protein
MPAEVRNPWTRIANLEDEVAELRRLFAEDHDRLTQHLDVHKVGGQRPPERR